MRRACLSKLGLRKSLAWEVACICVYVYCDFMLFCTYIYLYLCIFVPERFGEDTSHLRGCVYFLPNCSPGEDFAKNIESAFWQGEQIKTKLAKYWQMWEKIGKNIFVMALIMGWRYRTLSGRWAGHHLPVWPSGLFRLIRMGVWGVWGGLIDPFFSPQSFLHSPT